MAKTVEDYIWERLFDNASNTWDITVNKALVWFNRYLHRLENEIAIFLMEDSYDEGLSIDLVSWQSDYDLPTWDSSGPTIPWILEFKKLLECTVNYSGAWVRWFKAKELPDWSLEHPIEWYATDSSAETPMFKFKWKNKLTIFPTPTENITDWLKLRYAKTDWDVELDVDETELSIPRQYIQVILEWMSYQLAKSTKDNNLLICKSDYSEAKKEMLWQLSDRYIQPSQYTNPNLRHLMN